MDPYTALMPTHAALLRAAATTAGTTSPATTVFLTNGRGRTHLSADGRKPLCGGGNRTRRAHWQIDTIGPADCETCLLISTAKNNLRQRRPIPDMPVI